MLAEVEVKIDAFEERLTAYMRDLGIPELSEEEAAKLGLQPPDFVEWSALSP